MEFNGIYLFHIPHAFENKGTGNGQKKGTTRRSSYSQFITIPGAFNLDTCQRKLLITTKACFEKTYGVLTDFGRENLAPLGIEFYQDQEAYQFLLEFACGLQSAVTGETDVFGQFKDAWKAFENNVHEDRQRLFQNFNPAIQKIFEDTKEIRTMYLRGTGGSSYGSIVRKILRPKPTDSILVIGAGKLARGVIPYLKGSRIFVSNRSKTHLREMVLELESKTKAEIVQIDAIEEEKRILKEVSHLVICTPPNTIRDQIRINIWNRREVQEGMVIHMGCERRQAGPWKDVKSFVCLNDFFERVKSQKQARNLQFERARNACRLKARERHSGRRAVDSEERIDLQSKSA